MTIREVSNQLYSLSMKGYFNGERFTKDQLYGLLQAMFRTGTQYIGQITMPDGRWWFKVTKFSNGEYGYHIPETKEQNKALGQELIDRHNNAK